MIVYEIAYLKKKISLNEIMGGSLIASLITIVFIFGFFKYLDLKFKINTLGPTSGALGLFNLTLSPSYMDHTILFIGFNFVVLLFFLISKFEKKTNNQI